MGQWAVGNGQWVFARATNFGFEKLVLLSINKDTNFSKPKLVAHYPPRIFSIVPVVLLPGTSSSSSTRPPYDSTTGRSGMSFPS